MASWSETTKHEPSSINRGQRYEKGDRVSREQLNTITENSFYAVNKSDEALFKANQAYSGVGSNPNLLINPDFRINQRGQTTYSRETAGNDYTFDRWCLRNGSLTKVANGIEITNKTQFQQRFEQTESFMNNVVGKDVTLSISLDGVIYSTTFNFGVQTYTYVGDFNNFKIGVQVTLASDNFSFLRFYNNTGNTVTLNWAKLELGTIATQFVPRPYAEELAICQRYYQKYRIDSISRVASTSNRIYPTIYLCVPLRKIPTLTVSTMPKVAGNSISIETANNCSINTSFNDNQSISLLVISSVNITSGLIYCITGGELLLDAEV